MPVASPQLLLLLVFAVFVVFAYLGWRLARSLGQQLPAPVQRRGVLNALYALAACAVVFGVMLVGTRSLLSTTWRDSAFVAFGMLWALAFVSFFVSWLRGRLQAGPLLLDCGPHPTRWQFWMNAALFLLFLGGGGLARVAKQPEPFGIGMLIFGLTACGYFLTLALGHLQVRENGLWQYWGLLPWSKLRSYSWEGDCLMLQADTTFAFLGRGAIPVPSEHKAGVDQILSKHCPVVNLEV